jgi:hypothetical protein
VAFLWQAERARKAAEEVIPFLHHLHQRWGTIALPHLHHRDRRVFFTLCCLRHSVETTCSRQDNLQQAACCLLHAVRCMPSAACRLLQFAVVTHTTASERMRACTNTHMRARAYVRARAHTRTPTLLTRSMTTSTLTTLTDAHAPAHACVHTAQHTTAVN